jgi:hypothetical protein
MSGTVGDNTARASGVIAAAGGGKILQVVSAKDETTRTMNSGSYSMFGNTLTLTITPTATSSRIFLTFNVHLHTNAAEYRAMIKRDIGGAGATNLTSRDTMDFEAGYYNNNNSDLQYIDSPNTTSECVYEIYFTGGASSRLNSGVNGTVTGMSSSSAWEIEG